ncbi:flagellar hook-length control protein FliK [bacterium]|nr:flagellar hook-length control protein FliK [bacterium]
MNLNTFIPMPMPAERLAAPPTTDKTKQEDEAAEKRVDEARKEKPKEAFDTHLNRVLPPGWAPGPEFAVPTAAEAFAAPIASGASVKPAWLMRALGDVMAPSTETGPVQQVALRVFEPVPLYQANEVLEAVKEGAPIHEAHFPSLFVAQISHQTQKGEPVSRLSVQIAPEHLGQVQMTFTLQKQSVAVSVVAANQQAKEMLEQQLGAIQGVLASHNLKPAELKVEVAQQGGGANGKQFSENDGENYQTPNRWMLRRGGDLDEGIDVTVG